jgi:hypothetical protein
MSIHCGEKIEKKARQVIAQTNSLCDSCRPILDDIEIFMKMSAVPINFLTYLLDYAKLENKCRQFMILPVRQESR